MFQEVALLVNKTLLNSNRMPEPEKKTPTIEELSLQIENLNKGIAGYRDEARSAKEEARIAKEEAAKAKQDAESLKKQIEKKSIDDTGEEFKLSEKDQKRLKAWADQQGLVTKEELEAEKQKIHTESLKAVEQTAIADFLEKHPEYSDEKKWDSLKAEFSLYKTPTTPDAFKKLLNKIHKDLNPGKAEEDAKAKAAAEIIARRSLTLGGRYQPRADGETPTVEILQAKYPNLPKEVIETRLTEIKKLAERRKK